MDSTQPPTPAIHIEWGDASWEMAQAHVHPEIELGILVEGCSRLVVGGKSYRTQPGQVHMFCSTVPHMTLWMRADTTFIFLTLPLTWLMQMPLDPRFIHETLSGRVWMEPDEQRRDLDQKIFHQWLLDVVHPERARVIELEVEARINRLALSVAETSPFNDDGAPALKGHPDPARLGKVERIAAFVAEHYHLPLRISDIAQEVGMHPNATMRLFKKHWGQSLGQFIADHRLWHARRLLATTDHKVSTIAEEVGFATAGQLHTLFKQRLGQTPNDFRRAVR